MKQQEQVQWDDVNKLLQHHGFKPVFFTDPVENKNLTDLALLDKQSADELRTTLRTMMTDSERRQTLIQELVKSNKQLKEEVQKHVSQAAQQSRRASELERLLDDVKTRVQDLEDLCIGRAAQQHGRTQKLQLENKEAQKLCWLLEQKLSKQKEETAELQRKLYFTVKQEERRLAHRNIRKKVHKQNSTPEEAAARREGAKPHQQRILKKTSSAVSAPFNAVLQEHQKNQAGSRSRIEELKRFCLEQDSNKRSSKEDKRRENECVCGRSREARLCVRYHQLLTEISEVVSKAPVRVSRSKPSSEEFQLLLPTLENWAQQLQQLKDLQRSINKLSDRLMLRPARDDDFSEAVEVEDMMLLVDTMLDNVSSEDQQKLQSPTRYTLAAMVSHFQKLFDIPSLTGVYPRMNEVYTRLGEMTNAMRNLRDILELDSRASPTEVVNKVAGRVSDKHGAGFCHLLGDADVDSVIVKVKQHDEFFPAFHALVTQMLDVLGVSHLDDILPALKSLKQMTR